MNYTTIRLSKKIQKALRALEEYPKEPFQKILERLIKKTKEDEENDLLR